MHLIGETCDICSNGGKSISRLEIPEYLIGNTLRSRWLKYNYGHLHIEVP